MSDEPRSEPIVKAPLVAVLLTLALPALYWLQLRMPDGGAALAFSPTRFWQGDPRGLVSAIFLHGDWTHVAMNAVALLAFGAPVARLLRGPVGALGFLAFFIVCGVIGSIGYAFANPAGVGAWGASGGVFGLIGGALRMATPRGPILPLTDRRVLIQAGAWAAISVFVGVIGLGAGGTGAGIAWEAHLAGLAAGLLLVGPFVRLFPERRAI